MQMKENFASADIFMKNFCDDTNNIFRGGIVLFGGKVIQTLSIALKNNSQIRSILISFRLIFCSIFKLKYSGKIFIFTPIRVIDIFQNGF